MAKSIAKKMAEKLKMPEKPKGTPGRPSYRYDAKQAFAFIAELEKGERSIRAICMDKGMPTRATIFTWVRENPEFAALYHQARSSQMHGYVDDTVFIADTENDASKARIRIDARRWMAERLEPKHYGPRIEHEHVAQITTTSVSLIENLSPEDREALRAIVLRAQNNDEDARQKTIQGVIRQ